MGIPFIGDIIREVGGVVREIVPDADRRMEIELQFAELADRAEERENALLQGQIDVNKEEARSGNLFVAGWRPFIGWTSGAALGWTWIVAPFLKWAFELFSIHTELPALDPESIFPIVLAMLGISASRTYEKTKGVATSIGGVIHTPLKEQRPTQESVSVTPIAEPPQTRRKRWF